MAKCLPPYTSKNPLNIAPYVSRLLILHTGEVDEILQTKTEKPKVIITDIDETILNNSPYEAHQTLQGKDYESDPGTNGLL